MKWICWIIAGAVCTSAWAAEGSNDAKIEAKTIGESKMEILYIVETSISVDAMEERLRTAAKNHQFSILNVTDLTAKLRSNGLEFAPACKVFDICNPHRAKAVLDNKMEISTALPCRISVYEEEGKTKVSTLLPSKVLGMFNTDGLDSIAKDVENDLIAIINEAIAE